MKVLKAIREEFDRVAAQMPKSGEAQRGERNLQAPVSGQEGASLPVPVPAVQRELATVTVESTPGGCDIAVDGKYSGGTPATMRLAPGDHTISVGKAGFRTWQRTVTLTSGGAVTITPILDAEPIQVAKLINGSAAAPENNSVDPTLGSQDAVPKVANNTTPTAGQISDAVVGNGTGSKTKSENVGVTASASVPSNPSSPTTKDGSAEGRIGAWSDEKPRERHDGVRISGVAPRGPADEAGLEVGDFILAIGGHYIFTVEEMNEEVRRHAVGSRLGLRYRRYSTIYDTHIVLGSAVDKNRDTAR